MAEGKKGKGFMKSFILTEHPLETLHMLSAAPVEAPRSSYAKPAPQTAMVVSPATAIAGLRVDALEQRIERYLIPQEQVDAVTNMLADAKANDEAAYKAGNGEAYEDARKTAIAAFKQKHSLFDRIIHWHEYKGWKEKLVIPVPASERTELLESLVTTRDIVLEGYGRFKKLPDIISRTYRDYAELQIREKKLETEIQQMETAVKDAPAEIAACEQVMDVLSRYETLSAEEKQKVSTAVAQAFGRESAPSLESPAIRKKMISRFSEGIAQRQLNAMNYNANLELSKQELLSVVEQQKLIKEQMYELSQTWLPTLKHIDEARLRYDSMSRFAESAAEIIGMNKLRARNVGANAEALAAIRRALDAQRESRLFAEAVEAGAKEIQEMYAPVEAVLEEVVEVPVEPMKVERKA